MKMLKRIVCLLALSCVVKVQAATQVLVLGGSQPYNAEAAFPPSTVASNLEAILAGDSGVSQPVTVRCVDIYQSNAVDQWSSHCLMSWYYWPYTRTNTDALLGAGWNYVVMIDDPHVASTFPEYHFEGVNAISAAARKAGSIPVSVMTWSSGGTALSQFGEMAYRVGDGVGVAVAPAGYAWNNLSAVLQGSGTRPNTNGAYVTAATVYSRIYNRSAKTSTYIPSGVTQANRDTMADTALSMVQLHATNTHYSGVLVRPTHFASPLNKERVLEYTDFNSSTEWRIRPGFYDSAANAKVGITPYIAGYQGFPVVGHQIDICQMRDYYNADTNQWRNYACFDYHDNYGAVTMMTGLEREMYRYDVRPAQEQETGASDVTQAYIDKGEYFVPNRVMFSRIRTAYPTFPVYDDYHHLSTPVSYAMAGAMFTLLTGRCPFGDVEPADKTTAAWQQWYALKVGYEVAWQHATLNSRVPGFQVRPSSVGVNASNLTVGAIEPIAVCFRYAPTSTVTVTVSVDNTNAAILSPAVLTFGPDNYDVPQTVSVCGTPGPLANDGLNVSLATVSPDGVFNGLSDQWAYNTKRTSTTNVTVVCPAERLVTVTEDTPKVIDLGVAGATTNNTVTLGPVHGTWTAATFTYMPATNFYGADRIAFYVTANGTLTVNSVSITVTNVPEAVWLTSPTNGAAYSVVEQVPMSVSGYWAGGRVDYFANGVLMGSASDSPWDMTWCNMSVGSYGIQAVAYDISGVPVTSAVANVTITPGSGMWLTNSSGVWGISSNWIGGYIPAGTPALFNGVDIAGTITVQVDGLRQASRLTFGDTVMEETPWLIGSSQWGSADLDTNAPSPCWVISDGGVHTNTLLLTGSPAVIEVQDLGDRPMALRPDDFAAVMAVQLTVTNGLVKDGPGALVLNDTNTIGGGLTIQYALGGVMAGVNGALGNEPLKMYENTWLGSADAMSSAAIPAPITITNTIQLVGTSNANYRIGPGMAANLRLSGPIDGNTIATNSILMLGGRGRGIWAAGSSVPAQRTAGSVVGGTTFTLSGDVNLGTRTVALLGSWPCNGNLTNQITGGQVTAGNLMYDYAGSGQSVSSIGGNAVVNLSGSLSSANVGQLVIRDQAQVTVAGQVTGHLISITNQVQLTAAGLSYVDPATGILPGCSTVFFHGGTTDVKSIRIGSAHFNGGVVRAGCSTNNFLEGSTALLDGTNTVDAGGLIFDTDGYDVEISHPLKHGTATPVDGGLQKLGLGKLTLSATNTFNGAVAVVVGTLDIDGTLGTNSAVTVASGATLSGTGSIARAVVIQSGGILAPGASGSALTVQGALSLQAGSSLNVSWGNGAIVNGNVALSNSVLSITGTGSGSYLLIDNRGTNPVAGTFTGLPESALLSIGGVTRWLTYCGGDGNDVALRSMQITNLAASAITLSSATLQGWLQYAGGGSDVLLYWGVTDGGTNAAAWGHTNFIGSYTNVAMTNLAFNTGSVLSPGVTYYYAFRATNATVNAWAQPSASWISMGSPAVDNASGAINPAVSSATLQGRLTAGGSAVAWICWGDNDGGSISTGAWDKAEAVGAVSQDVVFTAPVAGLAANKSYFYRCFATNAAGQAWSATAISFNATSAAGGGLAVTNSGGTVTNYTLSGTNFTAHIFTNSGTFTVAIGSNVDVLVVAGGGGGGGLSGPYGSGGGAGGLICSNAYPVIVGSNYTITVGGGGAGNNSGVGANGTNSVFGSLIALGGGGGSGQTGSKNGNNGGSGGGGYNGGTAGTGLQPGSASGGYGHNGSVGGTSQGGGGGGAGTNLPNAAGDGGYGLAFSISGSNVYYAGGGNGNWSTTVVPGGGGIINAPGAANTGGGGGGASGGNSGSGGSGIVIVRYVSGGSIIQNLAPTGISNSTATLNAVLLAGSTNYAVSVYWGPTDGGTNAFAWTYSASVGSWTNVASTNISYPLAGLPSGMANYYAFQAANAGTNIWAQPSWQFTTPGVTWFDTNSAHLVGLASSSGTLTPSFATNTFSYTASVGYTLSNLTVIPTAAYGAATITVNGTTVTSGVPSGLINLGVGVNVITTRVVAAGLTATNAYVLTVTRQSPSTNALLVGLAPSSGTLSPSFSSNVFSYTASATYLTTNITLTPTVADATAGVTVNGTAVASGSPSGLINLSVGTNPITVSVISQGSAATNVYGVTVNRAAPAAPAVTNSSGMTTQGVGSATLQGVLTAGEVANAWICWGDNDAGMTSTSAWDSVQSMGQVLQDAVFALPVSGLATNRTYFYRCFVTNISGLAWSEVASTFNATPAGSDFSSGYRMKISFTNYNRTGTLTNFPALVVLSNGMAGTTFNFGTFLTTNGYDLRITDAAETTNLNYEIESWSAGSGAYVWVQVPQFYSNCTIWAKWGDASQTNRPAYCTNGATWEINYAAVWHLKETPIANLLDSSTNRNSATTSVATITQTNGQINGSLNFNNNAAYQVPGTARLGLTGGKFTLSAWVNLVDAPDGTILGKGENNVDYGSWYLTVGANPGYDEVGTANRLCVGMRSSSGAVPTNVIQSADVTLGSWVHVAGISDGAALILYVNGVSNNAVATTIKPFSNTPQLWMGSDSLRNYLNGRMDELRIEDTARSPNWIWACYQNQGPNRNSFVGYGSLSSGNNIQNLAPSGVSNNAARLNAALCAAGTNYAVTAYWGTTDGGTNAGVWTNSAAVGAWTNVASTNISCSQTSLLANTTYYYTFRAVNAGATKWAQPSWQFTTPSVVLATNNAFLISLVPGSGALSPSFASDVFSYTETLPFVVSNLTVTTIPAWTGAVVKVNGNTVASGSPSGLISLNVGLNSVTTLVVSSSRMVTNTYNLTVTRQAASTNAYLSLLVPGSGSLSPSFASNIFSYVVDVPYMTNILITPTAADAFSTITIGGNPVASGSPSASIGLNLGTNWINVLVVPEARTVTNTYAVNVRVGLPAPSISSWPTAAAIVYGQALSNATLSGGSASAPGSFLYAAPATVPSAGTYVATVLFRPTDTNSYLSVTGSVNVAVSKATPTISAWPTASLLGTGQALSNCTLSGGSASVAGSFAFDDSSIRPGNGVYSAAVTFTPGVPANYNAVGGTVVVLVGLAFPAAPAGLTATGSVGQVALNWSAVGTATNYIVKRALVSGGPYTNIALNASLCYTNTGLSNGLTYYFVVSALNEVGEGPNSSEASATLLPLLPFAEDFEHLAEGSLAGQKAWAAADTVVQTAVARDVKAAGITTVSGYLEQQFAGLATNVWTDLEIQPIFHTTVPSVTRTNSTAILYFNIDGKLVVYNGTNAQTLADVTITTGQWVRISVHLDYVARKWDVYLNATAAVTNLDFYLPAATNFASFRVEGGGAAVMAVDNIRVSFVSPWAGADALVDSDGDGLPDAYEVAHGLNPANASDALLDTDGDGMSNLLEYWAGTNPTNAASVLRIVALTKTNSDVRVWFNSVSGKVYAVEHASNLFATNNWSVLITTNGRNDDGVVQVTDPEADAVSNQFYRVRLLP